MNDPSNGVPPALLPHVHLVSNFRFPPVAHMNVETIVDYLLQAPSITRQTSPMTWTYLNAPADGTVLLVWQPPQLGPLFASDGYVWGDPEQAFSLDAKGYTVEMYVHRTGYTPPEQLATHGRRRYRLTASKNPSAPNAPSSTDPNLWLIHYSACEDNARVPANRIPVAPQTQQILNTRRYLQSQGQLIRKEFMLYDRSGWPTINLPGGQQLPPPLQQQQSQMPMPGAAGGPPGGRPPPAQAPYYQGPPAGNASAIGPSPSKRARQNAPNPMPGAVSAAGPGGPDAYFDDEEDTSRGDLIDHLTPREIAMQRYRQHHEWMEEILSSPYAMSQITPVDLGLGLKGELEALTKGVFDAPSGADLVMKGIGTGSVPARKGDLEAGAKAEFEKRVEEAIALQQAEMGRQRKRHERRMAKLVKRGERFRGWETRLKDAGRTEVSDEGQLDGDEQPVETSPVGPKETVEEIVAEVEAEMGQKIVEVREVVCRATGGLMDNPTKAGGPPLPFAYEKPAAADDEEEEEEDAEGDEDADGDVEMGNEAAGLLDQFGASGSTPAAVAQSTPAVTESAASKPASAAPIANPTTSSAPETLVPATAPTADTTVPTEADMEVDVEMAGVPSDLAASALPPAVSAEGVDTAAIPAVAAVSGNAAAGAADGADWVVVTSPTATGLTVPSESTATSTTLPAGSLPPAAAPDAQPDAGLEPTAVLGDEHFSLDLADDSAFGDAFLGTEALAGDADAALGGAVREEGAGDGAPLGEGGA